MRDICVVHRFTGRASAGGDPDLKSVSLPKFTGENWNSHGIGTFSVIPLWLFLTQGDHMNNLQLPAGGSLLLRVVPCSSAWGLEIFWLPPSCPRPHCSLGTTTGASHRFCRLSFVLPFPGMSKKRERSAKKGESGGGGGPDPSTAEDLLFHLASDTPPTEGKASKRSKPSNANDDGDEDGATVSAEAVAASDSTTAANPNANANGRHPAAIAPSSGLRHCDGFDVVRKGSRGRGRQLMVLPGALGMGSGGAGGGKLGKLKDATSACPVLYVEFPEVWFHGVYVYVCVGV